MDLAFSPSGFVTTIPDATAKLAAEYTSGMLDEADPTYLQRDEPTDQ